MAEENYGPWKVTCARDQIFDKVSCFARTFSTGRGIFGDTKLNLVITSSDKNAAPAIAINIPIMNLRGGVIYRLDDGEPQSVVCDAVKGDTCLIQGQTRTQWINTMAKAKTMVVRVLDQDAKPYDFAFDVGDFEKAMTTFNSFVNTHIP